MPTPAMIFYKDETGFFNGTACYCYSDPAELDNVLNMHFNSQGLAKNLVERGEIKTSGNRIFSEYSLDRDITRGLNRYRMLEDCSWSPRSYFFEDGAWHTYDSEEDFS